MKCFYLFMMMAWCFQGQAQESISQIQGKITGLPVNGAFKHVTGPPADVKVFNAVFNKLWKAASAYRLLREPEGFQGALSATISKYQPHLGEKRYQGVFRILFYNYTINNTGFVKPVDEAPATITMYLNSEEFFSGSAGFFKSYDKRLKIPHPFQKIPMTDSTDFYEEYSFKGYPFNKGYYADFAFRIIRGNDEPVFIPFTRKQYLEYLITMEELKKKETEKNLAERKKDLAEANKKLQSETPDQMKTIFKSSIDGAKESIRNNEANLKKIDEHIINYRRGIDAMSRDEANTTAYVDVMAAPNPLTERMAAPGRREGYPLFIVNPAYYDDRQSPSKTQSVVVCYWFNQRSCPEYMQAKVRSIFNGIDYEEIKKIIQ